MILVLKSFSFKKLLLIKHFHNVNKISLVLILNQKLNNYLHMCLFKGNHLLLLLILVLLRDLKKFNYICRWYLMKLFMERSLSQLLWKFTSLFFLIVLQTPKLLKKVSLSTFFRLLDQSVPINCRYLRWSLLFHKSDVISL